MPIYIGKQPLSLFKMRLPWEFCSDFPLAETRLFPKT